jgi:putative ABC transport system ATP-binding protein
MQDVAPSPLEVQSVSLTRGGRTVLRDVSARFDAGVVSVVVGPSGAGKTSLLRCMNGLERPDEGAVILEGRDVREQDPLRVRRRVGMIFQTPVLFAGGVRANLEYGLDDVADERLIAALDGAGLPPAFLDRPSSALSVGQGQRVTIARALVRDPHVLLMDEPTSALDKDAATRIEALIRSLAGRGLTVVLVTHDLGMARRVGDRAVLLVKGRAVARGAPEQIEEAWAREVGR